MVAAVLVELERHDRHPGAGKGALSYATQLLSTSQPIRAPRCLSALMAGEMINTHRETLAGKVARDPSFSELYIAHFLGVNGASRFVALLSDKPDKSAPEAFPSAAKANRTLFYAKADKAEAAPKAKAKPKALSVAEVHGRIDTMIDRRVTRYASVRSEVAPVEVAASE